jgi:ankyrin repeat protein
MANQPENIHLLASKGNIDKLRQLLENENACQDIDGRNSNWETALYSASAAGKCDAVKLLISSGAKVNARARKRFSPLHAAARFGHLEVLEELINSGAGLEKVTIRRMTPLALAARYGQTDCAHMLLRHGANWSGNGGDMFGRTPLHWAIKSGHDDIVSLLLEAGADVNVVDNFGKTPIMQVGAHVYLSIVCYHMVSYW